MKKHRCPLYLVCSIIGLLVVAACSQSQPPERLEVESNPDLAAHSAEFRQEVIKVTDGVYVAVGFGLANSVLLEGDDGVVIVDAMESAEAALPVKEAYHKLTSKPVKGIIYTHFHADHTQGAIGPEIKYNENSTIAFLLPTRTFGDDSLELDVAGLKLVLMHAPGETPDQISIWLPQKKVLLPADNFYRSFPNLYAIRGTAYRDVTLWVNSLDKMRELGAEYLVPHHTRPLTGGDNIYETLTNYRGAIQFVHDQTIRLMNQGLPPLEIMDRVALPAHLARQPYLHEYYGTVPWSVQAIFDGMAVKLDPEKSADVDIIAGFRFADAGEEYTVHVRKGVAEIQPKFPDNPDISLAVDSKVWKEVVTGFRNPALALVKDVDKEGGTLKIIKFLSLFKSDE